MIKFKANACVPADLQQRCVTYTRTKCCQHSSPALRLQDISEEYVACITAITDPSDLVLGASAAYQAAYASRQGRDTICTVMPPVPQPGTASIDATLTVQPRYDAEVQYSFDITLVAPPVPTAVALRNTANDGKHIEVLLDDARGLQQVRVNSADSEAALQI